GATWFYLSHESFGDWDAIGIGALVTSLIACLFWLILVNEKAVRTPAHEYAVRLVETVETLN
ncbi:MAG: hypothetical protein V3V10_05890, partial [Planctomycetota bacterium]